MNEKKLYQQKKQAQLDEWKADVDKLKAQASAASADAQLALNKQIKALEIKFSEGTSKLAKLEEASEEAWDSMTGGVEDAWDSMSAAFADARDKFKN